MFVKIGEARDYCNLSSLFQKSRAKIEWLKLYQNLCLRIRPHIYILLWSLWLLDLFLFLFFKVWAFGLGFQLGPLNTSHIHNKWAGSGLGWAGLGRDRQCCRPLVTPLSLWHMGLLHIFIDKVNII